jgi:hypothetical protein
MLNGCEKEEEYSKTFNAKGEYNSTEHSFWLLIFQKQNMINQLIAKLSSEL